jgi:hypothetical protein
MARAERENRVMSQGRFQFRLWTLHLVVACVALVLGAAHGDVVRVLLMVTSGAYVAAMAVGLICVGIVFLFQGAAEAGQCAWWLVRCPALARQVLFERRLKRIRPGTTSQFVRSVLGAPARVDGFGDRLYWSYRIAGQRYTVSFDPRRLVAKYSNGLARDLPKQAA